MAHQNEQLLRKAYADFGQGDLDAYWAVCSDDFTFHVPGRNQITGSYTGHARFLELIGKVMQLCGGAFEETVDDVLANDEHGVVLAKHRVTRDGRASEFRVAHVYNIRAGRLAECWEQPQDPVVFDGAWS